MAKPLRIQHPGIDHTYPQQDCTGEPMLASHRDMGDTAGLALAMNDAVKKILKERKLRIPCEQA